MLVEHSKNSCSTNIQRGLSAYKTIETCSLLLKLLEFAKIKQNFHVQIFLGKTDVIVHESPYFV